MKTLRRWKKFWFDKKTASVMFMIVLVAMSVVFPVFFSSGKIAAADYYKDDTLAQGLISNECIYEYKMTSTASPSASDSNSALASAFNYVTSPDNNTCPAYAYTDADGNATSSSGDTKSVYVHFNRDSDGKAASDSFSPVSGCIDGYTHEGDKCYPNKNKSDTITTSDGSIIYFTVNGDATDYSGVKCPSGSTSISSSCTAIGGAATCDVGALANATGTAITDGKCVASRCADNYTLANGACTENTTDSTCALSNGLGFALCPLVMTISAATDGLYNFLTGWLAVPVRIFTDTGTNSPFYIWSNTILPIANLVLVAVFLLIIYSEATGNGFGGLSNYSVKKTLPRLIVFAVLINISFYICAACVDLSNIIGSGVEKFVDPSAYVQTQSVYAKQKTSKLFASTQPVAFRSSQLAADNTIAGSERLLAADKPASNVETPTDTKENAAKILSDSSSDSGSVGGTVANDLGMLLLAIVAILLAALVITWLILVLRQIVIILLTVISPLAFAMSILPNTQNLFKKWLSTFWAMLIVWPAIGLVMGASKIARNIFNELATNTAQGSVLGINANGWVLAGLAASALALITTPFILKGCLGSLGKIGATMSGFAAKRMKGAGNFAKTTAGNTTLPTFGRGVAKNIKTKLDEGRIKRQAGLANRLHSPARSSKGIIGGAWASMGASAAALERKDHKDDMEASDARISALGLDRIDSDVARELVENGGRTKDGKYDITGLSANDYAAFIKANAGGLGDVGQMSALEYASTKYNSDSDKMARDDMVASISSKLVGAGVKSPFANQGKYDAYQASHSALEKAANVNTFTQMKNKDITALTEKAQSAAQGEQQRLQQKDAQGNSEWDKLKAADKADIMAQANKDLTSETTLAQTAVDNSVGYNFIGTDAGNQTIVNATQAVGADNISARWVREAYAERVAAKSSSHP